jgi:HEAT repeat protein
MAMRAPHLAAVLERTRAADAPYRADAVRRLVRAAWTDATLAADPRVRESLTAALDDPDGRVRQEAVPMAVRSNEDSVVDRLLADADHRARMTTAEALACRGDGRALPVLVDSLQEQDPARRSHAVQWLGVLWATIPDPAPVVPPMVDALHDEDPLVRRDAAIALTVCRADRRAATMARLPVRPTRVFMSIVLRDASRRSGGCDCLGRLGGPEVRQALNALTRDPDRRVASLAEHVLQITRL